MIALICYLASIMTSSMEVWLCLNIYMSYVTYEITYVILNSLFPDINYQDAISAWNACSQTASSVWLIPFHAIIATRTQHRLCNLRVPRRLEWRTDCGSVDTLQGGLIGRDINTLIYAGKIVLEIYFVCHSMKYMSEYIYLSEQKMLA